MYIIKVAFFQGIWVSNYKKPDSNYPVILFLPSKNRSEQLKSRQKRKMTA